MSTRMMERGRQATARMLELFRTFRPEMGLHVRIVLIVMGPNRFAYWTKLGCENK